MQINVTDARGWGRIHEIFIRGQAGFCLLMFTILVATNGCSQKWVPSKVHHQAANTLDTTNAIVWRKSQCEIHQAFGGHHYTVATLTNNLPHPKQPGRYAAPVLVFISPKKHNVWIGCPQHIYIETDHNIVGVLLLPFRGVQFTPSLTQRSEIKEMKLAALSKYCEDKYDYNAIVRHMFAESGANSTNPMREFSTIELRRVFKNVLFHNLSSGLDENQMLRLESFSIENGVLRMELSRLDVGGKGTVWFRIADRTLIRAVENGVRVYPAEVK